MHIVAASQRDMDFTDHTAHCLMLGGISMVISERTNLHTAFNLSRVEGSAMSANLHFLELIAFCLMDFLNMPLAAVSDV